MMYITFFGDGEFNVGTEPFPFGKTLYKGRIPGSAPGTPNPNAKPKEALIVALQDQPIKFKVQGPIPFKKRLWLTEAYEAFTIGKGEEVYFGFCAEESWGNGGNTTTMISAREKDFDRHPPESWYKGIMGGSRENHIKLGRVLSQRQTLKLLSALAMPV